MQPRRNLYVLRSARDATDVQVPLFQDMPNDFLRELCMHVVRFVFSPGEVIIYSDEPVHEIYIVHRGICQVRTASARYTARHRRRCLVLPVDS